MRDTLVLNASFEPLSTVTLNRAVVLVLRGQGRRRAGPPRTAEAGAALDIPAPRVIRLCQLCTGAAFEDKLRGRGGGYWSGTGTGAPVLWAIGDDRRPRRCRGRTVGRTNVVAEHGLPFARGGQSTSARRNARTPEQAGMPLLRQPFEPTPADAMLVGAGRERRGFGGACAAWCCRERRAPARGVPGGAARTGRPLVAQTAPLKSCASQPLEGAALGRPGASRKTWRSYVKGIDRRLLASCSQRGRRLFSAFWGWGARSAPNRRRSRPWADVAHGAAEALEGVADLAGDDPELVGVALGDLRQHLQVLVGEQLLVRRRRRGSPSKTVRMPSGLALGPQGGGLGLTLGAQDRGLLLALGGRGSGDCRCPRR